MKLNQFESEEMHENNHSWEKHITPLNKSSVEPMEEDANEIPEIGDTIRTKKMQMDGRVERIGQNRAGYDEVFFRIGDGRLMKTPLENVTVVEKLADDDIEIMEADLLEISNALLTKYKTAAAGSARSADAMGDIKTGNKRFSGIIQATKKQFANDAKKHIANIKEGSMGGINRCAPAQDVSYEKVLDRNPESAHSRVVGEEQINELSVEKMQAYKDKVASTNSFQKRPLRKLAKSSQAVGTVNNKISKKKNTPIAGTLEERLSYFLESDFNDIVKNQYKEPPKKKVIEINYHGWIIKYRPKSKPNELTSWVIIDGKGNIKNKGESQTDKDAVKDAEEWIKAGDGTKKDATSTVNIDFNAAWTKEFASSGDLYYVLFMTDLDGPVLMQSTEKQAGFKKTDIRRGMDQHVSLTPKESNAAGLQPNGRYLLGSKEEWDRKTNTVMFPLIFQGIVQDSNERFRMQGPGLTVAHTRRM